MPDLITIEAAEARYGVPAGTIRAFVRRDHALDPIGTETHVYDDEKLARLVSRWMAGRAGTAQGSQA